MDLPRRGLLTGSVAGAWLAQTAATASQPLATEPGATPPLKALVDAARRNSPDLGELMRRHLPGLERGGTAAVSRTDVPSVAGATTVPTAASGDVAAVWGQDFLFAAASSRPVMVSVDRQPPLPMAAVVGTPYWFHLETLRLGTTHTYTLIVDGNEVGSNDVAGYNPDSYEQPGVPRGTLSDRMTIQSRAYPGSAADCWFYANPGIDTARGAPLMVWQDGAAYVGARDAIAYRLQVVSDNLVAKGLMPPMAHVLIAPGAGGPTLPLRFDGESQGNAMRSLQYDTVSDRYGSYLMRDVLPEVERHVKLRQDGYSRAVAGLSSGAVCAFNVAWFQPERFSRVHSNIGSYTALQWYPERGQEGGNSVADHVRREARKNLRVWMSDGIYDMESDAAGRADLFVAGSWPLHNIALANALKLRGYDFHFRFGDGTHSIAQGALDLPESLAWLWRGYDPERTGETYEQEPTERAKPIFRVQIANRDAW